jgi:hypothetical protein
MVLTAIQIALCLAFWKNDQAKRREERATKQALKDLQNGLGSIAGEVPQQQIVCCGQPSFSHVCTACGNVTICLMAQPLEERPVVTDGEVKVKAAPGDSCGRLKPAASDTDIVRMDSVRNLSRDAIVIGVEPLSSDSSSQE